MGSSEQVESEKLQRHFAELILSLAQCKLGKFKIGFIVICFFEDQPKKNVTELLYPANTNLLRVNDKIT